MTTATLDEPESARRKRAARDKASRRAGKEAARKRERGSTKRRQRNSRPLGGRGRPNSLNLEAWVEFLETELLDEGEHANDARTIRGRPLPGSFQRSLYRWTREGWQPDFFACDGYCIYFLGEPIDVFMRWCEERDLNPWSCGEAPAWYLRDDWSEDLRSSDPQFRAEARAQKDQEIRRAKQAA